MRVIVTRPESEARRWVDELRRHGFDALSLPLIAIAPVLQPQALRAAWQQLGRYRAVMFVSGNAVRHFFAHVRRQRLAGADPGLGDRARARATPCCESGVPAASIDAPPPLGRPIRFRNAVAAGRRPGGGGRSRADRARRAMPKARAAGATGWPIGWQAAGAQVELVVAYRRQAPGFSPAQLQQAKDAAAAGNVWLFSSSQAIAHLRTLLPQQDWSQARAVATHPRIAQAARHAGFGVVCESRPAVDAVVAALESFR